MQRLCGLIVLLGVLSTAIEADERRDTNVFHLHLALSNTPGIMNLGWVAYGDKPDQFVEYGRFKDALRYKALPVVAASVEEPTNPSGTPWVHTAQLGALLPSQHVFYRVVSRDSTGKTLSTPVYQFTSKAEAHSTDRVRFAAFGDMGVAAEAIQTRDQLNKLVTSQSPLDFIVHLGDLAYTFGNWTKWNYWFDFMEPVAARTPYMVTPGNRDDEHFLRERFSMPRAFNLNNRQPECLAKNNIYYDFDYGMVGVVTLPWRGEKGKSNFEGCPEIFEWFQQTLEKYHYRKLDPRDPLQWIVVAIHTPFYSSSDGHPTPDKKLGGNRALKDRLEHMFKEYSVDVGIFGDDHNYERTHPVFNDKVSDFQEKNRNIAVYRNPKSTVHFLIGTGGIGLDGWLDPNSPPEWSAYREISHGFVAFEVTNTTFTGRYVRSKDGSEVDYFVIEREACEVTTGANPWILFWAVGVFMGVGIFVAKKKGLVSVPFAKGR